MSTVPEQEPADKAGASPERRVSFSGYLVRAENFSTPLDLDSDEPLNPVCDLSGEGDCEACQ